MSETTSVLSPAGREPAGPAMRRQGGERFGELLSFGAVGAVNTLLDIALFNVLLWWVMPNQPLVAKGVSISVATVSAYVMNRNLTWADRARTGLRRELPLFALLSLVGLGISEAALAVSHYGLGYTSTLADNVAGNGVGLVLASVWRFWSFRRWVFLAPNAEPNAVEQPVDAGVAEPTDPFPVARHDDARVA